MFLKRNLFFLFYISSFMAIAHENSTVIFHVDQIVQPSLDKDKDKGKNEEEKKESNKGGEKKDTASTDMTVINQKLDSVLNLMNAKVIPYIDAQNATTTKAIDEEIGKLKDELNKLKIEVEAKQKIIVQHLDTKSKTDIEINQLKDQVKNITEQLVKQKDQLKLEIDALQKQSYKIDETILKSIGERLKFTPNIDPLWLKTHEDFKVKRDLLWQADEFLSKPYDVRIKQLILDIDAGFSKGQQFGELTKAKIELNNMLSHYCENTSELKNLLIRLSKLNDFKDERNKKIEIEMFRFVGYDYLVSIILTNQTNFNYNPIKNTVTDCE